MIELTKKTRKRLRELLGLAYARELDGCLLKLSKKFDDWKDKKIDCWHLNDEIHKFHDGISRDLYNGYTNRSVHETYMISRALARNLIQKEDIPIEALPYVEYCTDFFENEESEQNDEEK